MKYKEKYEEYLKYELNYSSLTIKMYLLHLDKFLEYLESLNINFLKLDKNIIRNYLKFLDSQKLDNKSISGILSSLRCFYNYLMDENVIDNNPFKSIRNPKVAKKLPVFLSYEEMRKILDSLESNTFLEKRDKAIVELLYGTGIRVSELVNLKKESINYQDYSIRVYGKGKKERIVYFNEYTKMALEDLFSINTSEYVIVNKDMKKISCRGVEKIIDKICNKVSIKNHITPHTFRHTFATHLLNNGSDIKSVQELLGHESLNTTEIYTHITSDYLKSEYLKNMPR